MDAQEALTFQEKGNENGQIVCTSNVNKLVEKQQILSVEVPMGMPIAILHAFVVFGFFNFKEKLPPATPS